MASDCRNWWPQCGPVVGAESPPAVEPARESTTMVDRAGIRAGSRAGSVVGRGGLATVPETTGGY